MSKKETDKLYKLIEELQQTVEEMQEDDKAHKEKMEPVYVWFSHLNWAKKTFMWVLTLITTVAGAWLAVKELLIK